ncbi:MAG: hypothetical protein Q9228_005327, partial [Teloschistes exilis]
GRPRGTVKASRWNIVFRIISHGSRLQLMLHRLLICRSVRVIFGLVRLYADDSRSTAESRRPKARIDSNQACREQTPDVQPATEATKRRKKSSSPFLGFNGSHTFHIRLAWNTISEQD